MNLLGKITKTQLLLCFMTVIYLVSLTLWYTGADDHAAGTDYTITTARRESAPVTPSAPALVDINTATAEELQALSGIGAVTAQRIIDYRTEHGPFNCIEDLLHVSGIGEATLEKFRAHVTVSQQTVPVQDTETEGTVETPEHSVPDEPAAEPPAEPQTGGESAEDSLPPEPDTPPTEPDTASEPPITGEPEQTALIDINTATCEELQTLNGIGPVLAQRIIDYRTEHGPFTSVDELLNVKGIGEAALNKFRDWVTVSVQNTEADFPAEQSEPPADENTKQTSLIDINTATYEDLQTLNGIGPVLAQRIIDYRTEHGPFTTVDELVNVKGIGEATLNKFREQITVTAPSDETITPEEDPQ